MNYQSVLEWLYQQLPAYQNKGKSAFREGLDNIKKFSHYLGNPEHSFKSVHVAGTNGKGSTTHMLAAILQQSGYKVGLYTSPHLISFTERIRVNGIEIPQTFVVDFFHKHRSFIEQHNFSFFEFTVAIAFDYFRHIKVDVAVVEVGLGGRLDSTNIINPVLSVITNIGFDHTNVLGNTLQEIATQKAGIIKPKIPVVIGETCPETKPVFEEVAKNCQSSIYFADQNTPSSYELSLKGSYQKKNLQTVLAAVDILKKEGWVIPETLLRAALKQVESLTGLKGRWQQISEKPKVILDTAHNVEGFRETMKQVLDTKFSNLHMVLGFVSDKPLDQILEILPKQAYYYVAKPSVERGLAVEVLEHNMRDLGLNVKSFNTVQNAYARASEQAEPEDFIYVGGSTFVVADWLVANP